jgi:hypothetical protein
MDSVVGMGAKQQIRQMRSSRSTSSGIFAFSKVSSPALESTQPLNLWAPGALSTGVKVLKGEADHSPQSSAGVKDEWSYIYLHYRHTP